MGSLAKPGDPYVSPRGEVKVAEDAPIPDEPMTLKVPIARRLKINSRRNMNEMPARDAGTQTAINAILMYQLLGLTENETAHMLRLEPSVVQNIINGSDYQITFEMLFNEIINTNSQSLQATIASHAHSAILEIANLHKNAKGEMVRLKASQDLADRAGLDPEVLFGKTSSNDEQGFKITIIDEADGPSKTEINIDVRGKR